MQPCLAAHTPVALLAEYLHKTLMTFHVTSKLLQHVPHEYTPLMSRLMLSTDCPISQASQVCFGLEARDDTWDTVNSFVMHAAA